MGEGKLDDIKGRVKEAVGSLTGNDDLKEEGRNDQRAGKAKEKTDEAIDKARDFIQGDDSK